MSESSAPPAGRAPAGLLRASLLLLLGSAAAQAIPLLLGPLLTRLYSPEEFGRFQLFASVATNLAVLGCGRYEFALPLARDEAEAQALRRLCLRLLMALTLLCVPGGALAGSIGQLIGTGAGRGMGLMFIVLGLAMSLVAMLAYSIPALRRADELPDAWTQPPPEGDAQPA